MRSFIFMLGMCLGAPVAHAQVSSGTVSGRITMRDPRNDPYDAAGYPRATASNNGGAARLTNRFRGTSIVVSDVLVMVCVSLAYAPCTPLWTRTDGLGRYAVSWSGLAPPVAITTKVYALQPSIERREVVSSPWPPAATFRITTVGVTDIVIGQRSITPTLANNLNVAGNQTISIEVNDEEPTAAFQTAREVYSVLGGQV